MVTGKKKTYKMATIREMSDVEAPYDTKEVRIKREKAEAINHCVYEVRKYLKDGDEKIAEVLEELEAWEDRPCMMDVIGRDVLVSVAGDWEREVHAMRELTGSICATQFMGEFRKLREEILT